ncbi:MAG: hypothetical protein AVDCRST_MAG41-2389, partial [uncultured Corynebacteriales bacterium]
WSQDPVPAAARSERSARSPRPSARAESAANCCRRTTRVPTASSTRRARPAGRSPGSVA